MVEVDHPIRQARRLSGKSDTLDAIAAARLALSGEAKATSRRRDGSVEAIRIRAERLHWIPAILAGLDRPFVVEHPEALVSLDPRDVLFQ